MTEFAVVEGELVPIDVSGNPVPIQNGAAIGTTPGLIAAAKDGSNAAFLEVSTVSGAKALKVDVVQTTGSLPSTVSQGNQGTHAQRWMVGLSDGTAFYNAPVGTQLPTTLVGGRLDTNLGSWLGSTAPTVGQKTMANSVPVTLASDQSTLNVAVTNGVDVSGSTVLISNPVFEAFGNAPPTEAIQIGGPDTGGRIRPYMSYDASNNTGAEYVMGVQLRMDDGSGSSVPQGTKPFPMRIDPTGTTTQPVSQQQGLTNHAQRWIVGLSDGTAFVNPALEHITATSPHAVRLTDGTSFYASPSSAQLPSALVGGRLDTNMGAWLGSTAPTVGQKVSASSIPVVIASDQSNLNSRITDGTNTAAVKAGSTAPVAADPALVVAISPNGSADTTVSGSLNALSAAVSISTTSRQGVGFFLAGGTFIGTIVPEVSFDGGTTWVQSFFDDPTTRTRTPDLTFTAANSATTRVLVTPEGASNAMVRVSAFTSGSATANLRGTVNDSPIIRNVVITPTERATYSSSVNSLTPPATPTDMVTITGSASKTIRVLKITLTCTQNTAGTNTFFVVKRSTANTAGTPVAQTEIPYDSNFPTASGVVVAYTANPTLGTTVGTIEARKVFTPANNTAVSRENIFDFSAGGTKPGIVLRGTGQVLALNFNGAALPAGLNINCTIEWTEELGG